MHTALPFFVGKSRRTGSESLSVVDKFSGKRIGSVSLASAQDIEDAIALAICAEKPMARLAAYERRDCLSSIVAEIQRRSEEFASILCAEVGKTIRDARGEVSRMIDTFRIAAEEATRFGGEILSLDISPRAKGYSGQWKRYPIGACSFIVPFNFPLNLAAHKIAPAIAVGCPFILKPASFTPMSILLLGEILAGTALPDGAFSILPCDRKTSQAFTEDPRLKYLSFTGSAPVGWELKARAGKKKVTLELGGNAACIVDEGADVADAVQRISVGAFYQSGQSCISVQRIFAHASLYENFKSKLVAHTQKLKAGDPRAEETVVGPLISEKDAVRLEEWIFEAQKAGATLLCGGKRSGAVLEPTLLEKVPAHLRLCAEEAFGPVAILSSFTEFEKVIEAVNATSYGLQAGLFTPSIDHAFKAWDELEVGGVIINEVPSWRVDSMPYGGIKDSGLGREGVRFAMEEMSEIRMLVIRRS